MRYKTTMYKKQLTLTATAYLAFLFTFTACNVIEPITETPITEEVVTVPSAENSREDSQQEKVSVPEPEPTSTMSAQNKETEEKEAEEKEADQNSGSMSDNNNMGGMMAGGDEVPTITNLPDTDIDTDLERQALEILVLEKPIAMLLSNQTEWHVEMWFNEDEQVMEIDLFDSDWEWISWGAVSLEQKFVVDMYAPQPLSAEEYQTQQDQVEALVFSNAEVLAILGDPAEWEHYAWYDEWERSWDISFYKGLDEINIQIDNYDGEMMIGLIENLALLTEEQQFIDNQNKAIELAWGAEGLDDALFGMDEEVEWQTFVTHMQDGQYGVSFATTDQQLFFALVDINTDQVLESSQ